MFSLRKAVLLPVLVVADCPLALAQGYNKASSIPGFEKLVDLLGYDSLHADERDLMALMLVVFGLGFGYFSHLGFRESGFGVVLNGLVGLAGTCFALYLLGPERGVLSGAQGRAHDFLLAVLAAGAAVPTLTLVLILSHMRRRVTIGFFYGLSRRKLEAEREARLEPELPPRIAEILKK